jgi:hypothetical protein
MGREVKRVPVDFDWPINKVWHGYLSPDKFSERKCPDCEAGGTAAYEWLQTVAYVIAGLADDADSEARGRDMHPWLRPLGEISYNHTAKRPGPQFAEFANGIAPEAKPSLFGRDIYRVQRALIAAAGLPERWGICPTCDGHASLEAYPGQRDEAEAWEPTEPPEGEGWQYWETVSEGSPISPVFPTADGLSHWLQTDYHWGSSGPLSKEAADNMVQLGWAPSGIGNSSGFHAGDSVVLGSA